MKPAYKCDYCKFIGTKEEVKEHEQKCTDNYDRRNCYTCEHKHLVNLSKYSCDCGVELEENQIMEFCKHYKRKESKTPYLFDNIFGSFNF